MSEEPNGTDVDGDDSAQSAAGDAIGDMIMGIPAPIRKNAYKAFGQLLTAMVEYPVALIKNAVKEREAESRARVKLIDTAADQIAEQMKIGSEYARAAVTKFAQRIVRERVNVDQIVKIAAAELKSEPPLVANESEAPPISEDWLNAFESEAPQMSSEQMQLLFGKILAGEIRRPGAFSVRTIKLMAQLDNRAAALFQLLCSLSISMRVPESDQVIDARVLALFSAGGDPLRPYGLGFAELNILQEYGLIASTLETYMDYQVAVEHEGKVTTPLMHQNLPWVLVPSGPREAVPLRVPGIAFSGAGRELLPIVSVTPSEQFTDALRNFFEVQGLVMQGCP